MGRKQRGRNMGAHVIIAAVLLGFLAWLVWPARKTDATRINAVAGLRG